jgi:sulfite exporter TauE/SafE/copper chaperone CopZ
MDTKSFPVKGMHCKSCELLIEETLKGVPGVERADAKYSTGDVTVQGVAPDEAAITEAIRNAGYEVGREEPSAWISRDSSVYRDIFAATALFSVLYMFGRAQGWFSLSLGTAQDFGSLPFVLLVGLVAGISTCMAMVGGIVLGASARFSEKHPEATAREKFRPHIFFQAGRVVSFFLLGGLLGLFGSLLELSSFATGILSVAVAVVMFVLGLQLTGLFPRLERFRIMLPKLFGKPYQGSRAGYSHGRAVLLGAGTFFLPCGFTQAVQLYAVSSGNFWVGAMSMGIFALGTLPGLLGIGGISAIAKGAFSRYFFRFAGVLVVMLALFNMSNGWSLLSLGGAGGVDSGNVAESVKTNDRENAGTVPTGAESQVIHMDQLADGYVPNEFTVKKGQPVSWIIDSKDSYSCAVSLTVPSLRIRKVLTPGENVITFMPKSVGDIPFSCSMGMYRGVIHVIE